jgi:tetratricopeptide (TPR) repeat protein
MVPSRCCLSSGLMGRDAPGSHDGDRCDHVRSFSTDAFRSPLSSSSSLGLFDSHVSPHLESLSALPEINAADISDPTPASIEGLKRAVQIFEGIGGPLHTAVLVLLADAYQQTGQYDLSTQILKKLINDDSTSPTRIRLALSKVLCYRGDFDGALQISSALLDSPDVMSSTIARGLALWSQGTTRLLQLSSASTYQKSQDIVEVLGVAAKSLEPKAASAYNNKGIAQLVSEIIFLDRVRVDPAMTTFHKALEMTDDPLLVGRIYNNMATTLLLDDDDDDHLLKLASEYSRNAIRIYESATTLSESEKRAGLARALALAANCYVRADSAVTAEGLFQTAIETTGVDPLTKISQREAFRSYSDLCLKWDKRAIDAERLKSKGVQVNDSLPDGWKDHQGIVSGLTFPTTI